MTRSDADPTVVFIMATEVWFRNPNQYIRELVECGQHWITWDRGLLVKKGIDPDKHADLYFGSSTPWRALLVGEQGSAEIGPNNTFSRPKAVYPTWTYGEDAALLEEIIAEPVGEIEEYCNDLTVPPDERPVLHQEHRVVITALPSASTGAGRQILRHLKELQEDYPDCIIHVHGLYGWRPAFGLGFRAADVEPRTAAAKGKVHLPAGKEERYEQIAKHPHWATQLGYKPVDLSVPRVRCMYNIKSALWAGENYGKLFNFPVSSSREPVDTSSPTSSAVARRGSTVVLGGKPKPSESDMIACDSCSLSDKCKYYREGAVCSVPGSETSSLAKYFKTRDSAMIVDGLGELMRIGTDRLERGLESEEVFQEVDPEVTKLLNGLFEQGVKLAKLIDPNLRGGSKVSVTVGGGSNVSVQSASPQELVGSVYRELQAQGIPRDQITPDMVKALLMKMTDTGTRPAIEAEVISREDHVA